MTYRSETSARRHLTVQYCVGNGLDLGSAGDPVVPTAIQIEPLTQYTPDLGGQHPVQLRGSAIDLYWFRDNVMDYVYSSHLLEDFADWKPLLREWVRVLRPGGHLVIMIPDKHAWAAALAKGQAPNFSHKHEGVPGELTSHIRKLGRFEVIEDRITDGYNILFVAKKLDPIKLV